MDWADLLPVILIVGPILLLLVRKLLFLVDVDGSSMLPTFRDRDRVIVLRYWPSRWLHKGQIVVWVRPFHSSPRFVPDAEGNPLYIKRIVGLPGDNVSAPVVRLPDPVGGDILIDEAKQELKSWHIPSGHCFVKGDSPGFDSTQLGPLPFEFLRGVVIIKLPRRMKTAEESYLVNSTSHPSQKKP